MTATQATQDYLKAIYKLGQTGGAVTTNAIADRMGVAPASVTKMVKRLADLGLLTHTPYYGVRLTDRGERAALEVIRHHRLLELYLTQKLGVPIEDAHAEAERLEHALSESVEARIALVLGDPRSDPHGDPIPSVDGKVDEQVHPSLSDASPGRSFVVARVSDSDPARLRWLASRGLLPGVRIRVLSRAPNGAVTLHVGSGPACRIPSRVGRGVFVRQVTD
jgi:DtxR family Mn-dependent transcriptional regulator